MPKNKQGIASTMHEIREILRLHFLGLSQRKIARALRRGKTVVQRFTHKAEEAGLNMNILDELSDKDLQNRLSFFPGKRTTLENKEPINFGEVFREMRGKKHVTLQLLWEEYCQSGSGGHYSYSTFCDMYKEWKKPLNATLRKNYQAGQYLFVDFSGSKIPYYDPKMKEWKQAEFFVATLGCSNYTYAEACKSQDLQNWIRLHQNTFSFFGGVPKIVVPDNLKSGVTKSDRFDPDINPTYLEMARHYNTAILPARAHKPKDKAKVEGAVLIAQRWILARLRKMQFFSLDDINKEISILLERMNQKPFQKLEGCRKSLFQSIEKSALLPLPQKRFEYCTFTTSKVHIDYHIRFEDNYYSAPWQLIGKYVTVRATASCIELLHNHQRVASHIRTYKKWQTATDSSHRPEKHRHMLKWNPYRLRAWAESIGPHVYQLADEIFSSYVCEDAGIKRVMGILNLSKNYNESQIDHACKTALELGCNRVKHIRSLLEKIQNGKIKVNIENSSSSNDHHEFVRGPGYYCTNDNSEVN
jgi:transposase